MRLKHEKCPSLSTWGSKFSVNELVKAKNVNIVQRLLWTAFKGHFKMKGFEKSLVKKLLKVCKVRLLDFDKYALTNKIIECTLQKFANHSKIQIVKYKKILLFNESMIKLVPNKEKYIIMKRANCNYSSAFEK